MSSYRLQIRYTTNDGLEASVAKRFSTPFDALTIGMIFEGLSNLIERSVEGPHSVVGVYILDDQDRRRELVVGPRID